MTLRLAKLRTTHGLLLYVVGAAIQSISVFLVLESLFARTNLVRFTNIQTWILLIGTYLLGVFYCVFASFTVRPKRLFSPIPLQIIVWSNLALAYLILLASPSWQNITPLDLPSILVTWTGDILVVGVFLSVLGVTQFLGVQFLVGLNGMESDVTRIGWHISAQPDIVLRDIQADVSLRRLLRLDYHRKQEGFVVLQSRSGRLTQVFVVIAPSESGTDVVFLCYDKLVESIVQSPVATELSRILETHLTTIGQPVSLPANAPIIGLGLKFALRATMPRVVSWSGSASRWKGFTVGLLGVLAVVYFLWSFFGIGSQEFVLTMAGFTALDLIWILAPIASERTKT